MKILPEKKCIYLLLFEISLSLFIAVVVTIFAYGTDNNILQKNIFYQTVTFFITLFIYYNVSKINNALKIASFLIIFKTIINIIINVILPKLMIFYFSLSNGFKIIYSLIGIPLAFFFYKGLEELVSKKTKNIILANKWKKLSKLNIILSILNFIICIYDLYGSNEFFSKNLKIYFLLSLALGGFAIYLGILEIIYLLKTAKEL